MIPLRTRHTRIGTCPFRTCRAFFLDIYRARRARKIFGLMVTFAPFWATGETYRTDNPRCESFTPHHPLFSSPPAALFGSTTRRSALPSASPVATVAPGDAGTAGGAGHVPAAPPHWRTALSPVSGTSVHL